MMESICDHGNGGEYSERLYLSIWKLTSSITTEEASTTEDSTTEVDIETATTEKTEDSKSSICSFSSERLLTDDDIKSIMKKDYSSYHFPGGRGVVQMMINEIFARQGYVFNDSALNDYFGQFDWYKDLPKNNSSSSTVEGQMTRTERKNIKKLNAYE